MTPDKFTEIKFNYKHSDLMVKFNSIHIDSKNPRIGTNPKDDQSLQESVLENGLNMQIVIAKTDKKGEYVIVFGHRRYDIFVEAGYKNTNPLIPCTVITPFDEPDRPLSDDEIFDYRNADESYQSKLSFHERIVNIFQKTEEKLDAGMNVQQIAEKVFHKKDPWLRNNLNAFRNPTIRKAIEDGEVTSMHQAWNLLGIDAEAQETLIDAKKDIKATGMEKAAKLVREGTETASAIESVKHPEDERTLIIRTAPEDAQERLLDATKDMDDTERVVKQVSMGVGIDEAIRAVKLSKVEITDTSQQGLSEGELTEPPVDDGEGGSTEEALLSPETDDIISKAFERGGEQLGDSEEVEEPEEEEAEEKEPKEEATEDEDKDKKPEVVEKKKEPPICAKAGEWENELQKFVKIPPKTFLARFKTASHKGNFKNRVEGIHLWSGELSDLMESDLNGDSLFVCEVNRKRNALLEILARPKHSIIKNEREKFDDLMNELKTKIDQNAKRGG